MSGLPAWHPVCQPESAHEPCPSTSSYATHTTTSPDEGHVVHLGAPKVTARWTMLAETIAQIPNPDFHDDDFNIVSYETCLLNPQEDHGRMNE